MLPSSRINCASCTNSSYYLNFKRINVYQMAFSCINKVEFVDISSVILNSLLQSKDNCLLKKLLFNVNLSCIFFPHPAHSWGPAVFWGSCLTDIVILLKIEKRKKWNSNLENCSNKYPRYKINGFQSILFQVEEK